MGILDTIKNFFGGGEKPAEESTQTEGQAQPAEEQPAEGQGGGEQPQQ